MKSAKSSALAARPKAGLLRRTGISLVTGTRMLLGSEAVARPRIDPKLETLSPIERSAEIFRFSVLRAEHWMSPGGSLRAVFRITCKVALFVGIQTLIAGPVILLFLDGAVAASVLLLTLAGNLLALLISVLLIAVVLAILSGILRVLQRR